MLRKDLPAKDLGQPHPSRLWSFRAEPTPKRAPQNALRSSVSLKASKKEGCRLPPSIADPSGRSLQ